MQKPESINRENQRKISQKGKREKENNRKNISCFLERKKSIELVRTPAGIFKCQYLWVYECVRISISLIFSSICGYAVVPVQHIFCCSMLDLTWTAVWTYFNRKMTLRLRSTAKTHVCRKEKDGGNHKFLGEALTLLSLCIISYKIRQKRVRIIFKVQWGFKLNLTDYIHWATTANKDSKDTFRSFTHRNIEFKFYYKVISSSLYWHFLYVENEIKNRKRIEVGVEKLFKKMVMFDRKMLLIYTIWCMVKEMLKCFIINFLGFVMPFFTISLKCILCLYEFICGILMERGVLNA